MRTLIHAALPRAAALIALGAAAAATARGSTASPNGPSTRASTRRR